MNPTRLTVTEQKILAIVAELKVAYGLQIVRAYGVAQGSVYSLLGRLVDRGFLRAEEDPRAGLERRYWVTDDGARALKSWEAARRVWD